MITTLEEINGKYVAILEGEMDTQAAREAEETLKSLYDASGKDVVIECGKLEYISSSGLRILLTILKTAKAKDCKVTLCHVNQDIRDIFRLTGFDKIFDFE